MAGSKTAGRGWWAGGVRGLVLAATLVGGVGLWPAGLCGQESATRGSLESAPDVRRAPAAQDGAAPGTVVSEGARALDAHLRELVAMGRYSGGVLVARGEEVRLRSGYGLASREFGVANTPATRFILGSINKMFTAVAVLRLVERGRLELDDVVAEHLPGVLPDAVAGRITIEQLLTHTSGLGDFLFTPEMERANRADYRVLADYLPLLADDTLAFEPGSRWGYSNTGFLVLGAILEAVTGEGYYAHVREHVLEPAGMVSTGWPELDRVPRNVASTYTPVSDDPADGFTSDRYVQVVKGTPAGGGFSTLADMRRFAEALMDGRLLRPETVATMLAAKPALSSEHYGYGAQIFPDGWVGHSGGGPGTADLFAFHPGTEAVVVIMGNQAASPEDILDVLGRAQTLGEPEAAATRQHGLLGAPAVASEHQRHPVTGARKTPAPSGARAGFQRSRHTVPVRARQ